MSFISIKLSGRLGNQLYSHSAAQALAIKHGVEYLAYPKPNTHYEENYFEGKFPAYSGQKIEFEWNEPAHGYNEVPFKPNMLINGYMQSYKYFEGLEDQIFPKFGIVPILKPDTCCVHARFGDFKTIIGKHVVMTQAYLKSAIRYFNGKGVSKFFICSDEIETCKTLFNVSEFSDCTFTFSEGKTPLQDMAELAGSKYIIGSASTFSYWGYFLSPYKDKQLILPDKLWGATHRNMVEEYPPNTIKINTEGEIVEDPYKTKPTPTEIIEETKKETFSFNDVAAYYVNLDKRTDRNERMKETLAKAGIQATRVRGILPEELDLSNPKYTAMKNRTVGATGCFEAQLQAMKMALGQNKDCLVMEDDLVICDDALSVRMPIIEKFMNENFVDVFWLGGTYHVNPPRWHDAGHSNPELKDCTCTIGKDAELTENTRIIRTFGAFSTYAYIVNKKSLAKIIKLLEDTMSSSIGIDFSFIRLQPFLKTYAFVAGICKQYNGQSNIGVGETLFENFKMLGAHWYSNRMEDFDPDTYNWGEAAIRTQPAIESKVENTEAPVETKQEPTFEANTPEWFLQQAGIYTSLKDAGLLEAALVSINKHTKHKLETNLDGLQKELLGTCRFDCSFYLNKYKQ